MRLLLLLSTLTLAGCSPDSTCKPFDSPFDIDAEILESDVFALLDADPGVARADLPCASLCEHIYPRVELFESTLIDIRTCEHELDDEEGATAETPVGRVQCSGSTRIQDCE